MFRCCCSIKLNLTICSYNMPNPPAPNIFSPVAGSSQRPRPRTESSNPALCNQCNASLHLEDIFLEPLLKRAATGEPYLDYDDPIPKSVFEGIDYVRHDQIPSLPILLLAAESGCVFCAALRDGLQSKYQECSWWRSHPEPLEMRIQYGWTFSGTGTHLDSVVVSVFHPELEIWDDFALRFLAYAAEGTSIHLCHSPLTKFWSCLSSVILIWHVNNR